MSKTVMADSLTKDGRFFTNHALEEINGKTRKKNSRGRKTRSKRQRGGNSEAQEEKDKDLFDAIDISDYDKVENALNNGANVNARNKDGDTPLIRAIELEDIDMIYLLLERPDINIDLDLATNKELQLAEDLWDDMTPEDQEENGIPYAIEDYIVTKKEKKRIQNIVAQTIPKHLERQEDRKNLAMVMSEKDVGNRGDGTMPLELRHEIGKYLGGGKRRTRSTRQKGGDNVNAKDANGSTALIRASWDGDTEIVAMLLEKGADVNAKDNNGSTALMKASLNGHTKVVSMLLEKGADVNAKDNNGSTALNWASLQGHTEIVRMLLEKGADVNVKTDYGSTALALASWNGETEIVRMLLEKGADVNAKDANGSTALMKASLNGYTKVVSILLEKGADVNAKHNNRSTALMKATWDGDTEIVAMLLEKGADVNAKDADGSTALIKASLNGHTKVVSMLLEKGADVNAKNNAGNTAFFLANRRFLENRPEYTEIVKLLKQSIAAQTFPKHLERQEDRKNLAMVMRKKDVGNRGDGTMPLELRHEIGKYLGGGKRRTRKKNSRGRKTRKKNSGGRKTPNAKRGRKLL